MNEYLVLSKIQDVLENILESENMSTVAKRWLLMSICLLELKLQKIERQLGA